tara:strand:+ start:28959 stop:30323 length:1365 start_codon:yes stop_codon:yes gene_type:complete
MKTELKKIPSVSDVLLELNGEIRLHQAYLKHIINKLISELRDLIKNNDVGKSREELMEIIVSGVHKESASKLINVINGTGIVLHTGFGRAPFDGKILKRISNKLNGYVNLEYDLATGIRGDRQVHIREHLNVLCGSESSIIVNNNAAAVLLSLNTLAKNGEVICSRGQLVEIGGSFRIPDIISDSGACLKEVGTTNRTHIKDYENAISDKTKLILWVHTSNYVVRGFTKEIPLKTLVGIGNKHKIPVLADLGSGSFIDLSQSYGFTENPVKSFAKQNPDIITFSGDKLLGGPQSGLVIGKKVLIDSMSKNSLYRALRCDKITISLMDETIRSYRSKSFSSDNFSLKMLTSSRKLLLNRAKIIYSSLNSKTIEKLGISIENTFVEAGSGSLPEKKIPSIALKFKPEIENLTDLSKKFRCGPIPVVGYISSGNFYIDLKAVLPNQLKKLTMAISEI